MCFIIREEKVFDKYMEILEKVSNIVKGINNELIYGKKYLIAKKTFAKGSFECFYRKVMPVPIILIDSVYRKDKNYYLKVFLKRYCSFW